MTAQSSSPPRRDGVVKGGIQGGRVSVFMIEVEPLGREGKAGDEAGVARNRSRGGTADINICPLASRARRGGGLGEKGRDGTGICFRRGGEVRQRSSSSSWKVMALPERSGPPGRIGTKGGGCRRDEETQAERGIRFASGGSSP